MHDEVPVGIAVKLAYFVIRQHASTLVYKLIGKLRKAGKVGQGRQRMVLTDPRSGKNAGPSNAFQRLTDTLRSEIDTLAYPKAALFSFCLACVAYDALSLVKAALRATLGADYLVTKLSTYYLTLEVAQMTRSIEIAIGEEEWRIFRTMSQEEFLATILDVASRIQIKRYRKHKRAPKPRPKTSGKRRKHLSTASVLTEKE